jgi:hypothetical protein
VLFKRRNNYASVGFWILTDDFDWLIFPAAQGPGVYSASNRNEYQKQKNNVSGE